MLGLHENYKSMGATVGLVFLLCLSVWPRNTLLFLLIAALYVVPIAIGGWCINRIAEHIRPCLDTMDDWFIKNDYSSMRSWNICKPDTCPGKICVCTTWLVLWVPFMYFCYYFYAVLPLPFGGGTVVDLSEQLVQRQGSESNATSAPDYSQFGLVLDTLNIGIYCAFFYLFLRLLVPLGFDRYLGAHRWVWWQSLGHDKIFAATAAYLLFSTVVGLPIWYATSQWWVPLWHKCLCGAGGSSRPDIDGVSPPPPGPAEPYEVCQEILKNPAYRGHACTPSEVVSYYASLMATIPIIHVAMYHLIRPEHTSVYEPQRAEEYYLLPYALYLPVRVRTSVHAIGGLCLLVLVKGCDLTLNGTTHNLLLDTAVAIVVLVCGWYILEHGGLDGAVTYFCGGGMSARLAALAEEEEARPRKEAEAAAAKAAANAAAVRRGFRDHAAELADREVRIAQARLRSGYGGSDDWEDFCAWEAAKKDADADADGREAARLQQLLEEREQEARREGERVAEAEAAKRRAEEEARKAVNLRRAAEARAREAQAQMATGWECLLDDGTWTRFDVAIEAELERAHLAQSGRAEFSRGGVPYVADLARMVQVRNDGQYRTERSIRRVPLAATAAAPPPQAHERWRTPATRVADGVIRHEIRARSDTAQEVSLEVDHFNRASGHYTRLMGGGGDGGAAPRGARRVLGVDVYDSAATLRRFNLTRERFLAAGHGKEIWVFHGSNSVEKVVAICSEGFRVGGADDGVPIANGDVHGRGVYAADGPRTPSLYAASGGEGRVILARALLGRHRDGAVRQAPDESLDSWRPRDDWIVFKDGGQLLPVYVLHFA